MKFTKDYKLPRRERYRSSFKESIFNHKKMELFKKWTNITTKRQTAISSWCKQGSEVTIYAVNLEN